MQFDGIWFNRVLIASAVLLAFAAGLLASHGAGQVEYVPRMCPVAETRRSFTQKHKTDVVMFVPTPVPWEDRRAAVHRQFVREGWHDRQVVLLFVLGTVNTDVSGVKVYAQARYLHVPCYDEGDRFNEAGDQSATTCKVYEALKHVYAHYEARYVWRGADDSHVNLPYFFKMAHTLPASRLYYGRLRKDYEHKDDLSLAQQPKLQELFGLLQFGQYMLGMGFVFSYDVVEFVAELKIPPHLTWCEDVMVGMWLNPFQVRFVDAGLLFQDPCLEPVDFQRDYLLAHRMTPEQWRALPRNRVNASLLL
jgi:hypothetical protein